ncbi:MAG: SUMF1/EgtB/PvdO family nonheme iron enzyme [Planctomycetaceae bacterium]|jgi:WD40 repeat protein/formylglycine-generating enzyme required for sulfatase activity|nr:SUMF1/EgtB/PvdO family nonheme iron enzyme [Planctomycetaceae bacterium]
MANWYYYDNDLQKQGPINDTQVKILAGNGRIRPETIMETETGQQGLAGQIPGLTFLVQVQPKRKKGGTAKFLIGSIAVLAVCGVVAWAMFGRKTSEVSEQANQEEAGGQADPQNAQKPVKPAQKGLEPEYEYIDLIAKPREVSVIGAAPRIHSVGSAAFSPDGKWVLTAGSDETIRIWETATGKELRRLDDVSWGLDSAAFSPNGKWVLTDHGQIWDAVTGKKLRQFGDAKAATFSPDGKLVLTANGDAASVSIWNAATAIELQKFDVKAKSAVFSPDGKLMLTGDSDGTIRIWNAAARWGLIKTFVVRASSAAFSPDSKRLLTTPFPHQDDAAVQIWDIAALKELWRVNVEAGSAAFAPDGKSVLTVSDARMGGGGVVQIWDTATAKELWRVNAGAHSAVFSPDGKWVLTKSGSGDGHSVQIWETATEKNLWKFDNVSSADLSPDGKLLLTVKRDGVARIWNLAKVAPERAGNPPMGMGNPMMVPMIPGQAERRPAEVERARQAAEERQAENKRLAENERRERLEQIPAGCFELNCNNFSFAPDGKKAQVTYAGGGEAQHIVDTKTGKELCKIEGASSLMFSPDSKKAAAYYKADRAAWILAADTGKKLYKIEEIPDGSSSSLIFSPDSKKILVLRLGVSITGGRTGIEEKFERRPAEMLDADTGKKLYKIEGDMSRHIHFSDDGKKMRFSIGYSGPDSRGFTRFFAVDTGKELCKIEEYAHLSHDGKKVMAYKRESDTTLIFDAETGKESDKIKGQVCFSTDGKKLIVRNSGQDGENGETVRVLDAKTKKELYHIEGYDWFFYSTYGDGYYGRRLIGNNRESGVFGIFDEETGKQLCRFEDTIPFSHRLSPDGKKVMVFFGSGNRAGGRRSFLDSSGICRIFDVDTGKELYKLNTRVEMGGRPDVLFSNDFTMAAVPIPSRYSRAYVVGDTAALAKMQIAGRPDAEVGAGGNKISDIITVPVATLFRAREMTVFRIQIPEALKLYKAENDNKGPETHEAFMKDIIKKNSLKLPELPDGQEYIYDAEKEELMIKKRVPGSGTDAGDRRGPASAGRRVSGRGTDDADDTDTQRRTPRRIANDDEETERREGVLKNPPISFGDYLIEKGLIDASGNPTEKGDLLIDGMETGKSKAKLSEAADEFDRTEVQNQIRKQRTSIANELSERTFYILNAIKGPDDVEINDKNNTASFTFEVLTSTYLLDTFSSTDIIYNRDTIKPPFATGTTWTIIKRPFPLYASNSSISVSGSVESIKRIVRDLRNSGTAYNVKMVFNNVRVKFYNDGKAEFAADFLKAEIVKAETPQAAEILTAESSEQQTTDQAAQAANPKNLLELTIKDVKFRFRCCPAGQFTMGSPIGEWRRKDDETQHQVVLTKDFYMGETKVTQAQWMAVMGTNPSKMKNDTLPAEQIRWGDCKLFVEKLNKLANAAPDGYQFAMPTEAQWEYACRAGNNAAGRAGNNVAGRAGNNVAGRTENNAAGRAGNNVAGRTENNAAGRMENNAAGRMENNAAGNPNAWNLRDMNDGSVFEWCSDWYGAYPAGGVTTDPEGAKTGKMRVVRGDRSAQRGWFAPGTKDDKIGFRLSLVPQSQAASNNDE